MAKFIEKLKREIIKTKPKSKSISFKIREDYAEALEIISKATNKTKGEIIMELMDEAGMMDEKNLEYFKSVIEEMRDEERGMRDENLNQGANNERGDTQVL